ncbi:MAG TPA: HAD-IA family hydrolase [Puia sp.]|jgi:HAD superfamily hydrolase (TIGR01549 family)|nr:HAD-IA family hydrolase [Puia sp.]
MKVAVHAHLHYSDLVDQIARYLGNIPIRFDLFITITEPEAQRKIRSAVRSLAPKARLEVIPVVNQGRDVKPFYTDIAPRLEGYDVIGHIHGKKSSFNRGATSGWLEYLLDALMGNRKVVEAIFDLFERKPEAGLIYPPIFHKLPYWANTWLSNRRWAEELRRRLNLPRLPPTYFSYPAGNMFWARAGALRPLFELRLKATDYPQENGQTDGEIMHALERIVAVSSLAAGYSNYIVRRDGIGVSFVDQREGIDFSAYYANSLDTLQTAILKPGIRVVSFDIFDTLVFRCLSDPEDIFDLMQPQVEKAAGRPVAFRQLRAEADGYLRSRLSAGTDVTLPAIYARIGELLKLSPAETMKLMKLELRLERKFMRPRKSVVKIMEFARSHGKRVILASDMYLDRSFVESMLHTLGITAWQEIYLSSATGWRKDNRTMFPYILQKEGIGPGEMIHIGDNEHSDLQIPADIGITVFHIMRAKELFLQTPLAKSGYPGPWEKLPLFARITLGLQFVRQFDDPFPGSDSLAKPDLHSFGYCYFGPTLLAFTTWVAERAREENIAALYFLARDGDVLIRIYRLLQAWLPGDAAQGIYLEASRRSAGVAFIEHREQLNKLLQPAYPAGALSEFVRVRLGIDLSAYPEIDVRAFGFADIHSAVSIPADLEKIRRFATHLLTVCAPHFQREKERSLGYLKQMGFFEAGDKAVVDIGYSGTLQRILNDVSAPVHGYYMVTYPNIENLLRERQVRADGLFGNRIDPGLKELSIERFSLFYEMVLSAVQGPVVTYTAESDGFHPVYAPVSPDEKDKLLKLPLIHEGILDYCRDALLLLEDHRLVRWDDHPFLLTPFRFFMEHPTAEHLAMLSGYSLDDYYCGQGILYWSPPAACTGNVDHLWKRYVPEAALWADAGPAPVEYGQFANRLEYEIFDWYRQQYEELPAWYKRIGQLFKILKGKKRLRIVLEDVGYVRERATKAQEIQAWYDKEYEVLPRWYKRFGQFVRIAMGKRTWRTTTQSPNTN